MLVFSPAPDCPSLSLLAPSSLVTTVSVVPRVKETYPIQLESQDKTLLSIIGPFKRPLRNVPLWGGSDLLFDHGRWSEDCRRVV